MLHSLLISLFHRFEKLSKLVRDDDVAETNKNPLAALEDELKEHQDKMEKMELEMDHVLEKKVPNIQKLCILIRRSHKKIQINYSKIEKVY